MFRRKRRCLKCIAEENQLIPKNRKNWITLRSQFAAGGKKKWVRYDEGALLYSMGIHSFMELAKEAKAVYHIKRIVLVNTEKLDEYIEVMYSDDPE